MTQNLPPSFAVLEKINTLLDDPTLSADQKAKLVGKLTSMSNAQARAQASLSRQQRDHGKRKQSTAGPTAVFSCIARSFPADWTQAQINEVTGPISREMKRINAGGIRTYPSHYQALLSV